MSSKKNATSLLLSCSAHQGWLLWQDRQRYERTSCKTCPEAWGGHVSEQQLVAAGRTCRRRVVCWRTVLWSAARSPEGMLAREKCACSSALTLVCGSVHLGASTGSGACSSSFRTWSSSPARHHIHISHVSLAQQSSSMHPHLQTLRDVYILMLPQSKTPGCCRQQHQMTRR